MKYFVSISLERKTPQERLTEWCIIEEVDVAHACRIAVDQNRQKFAAALGQINHFKINYCQPIEGPSATSPVLPIMRMLQADAEDLKEKGDPLWLTAQALYEGMHDEFVSRV